jgi:hypothetical protein
MFTGINDDSLLLGYCSESSLMIPFCFAGVPLRMCRGLKRYEDMKSSPYAGNRGITVITATRCFFVEGNGLSSIEKPKSRSKIYVGIAVIVILVIAIGASVYFYTPQQAQVTGAGPIKVAFISSAPMEEPWTSVIHKAPNYPLPTIPHASLRANNPCSDSGIKARAGPRSLTAFL